MAQKIATIDLGSNSFHLLISHFKSPNCKPSIIHKEKYKVRLRAGLDNGSINTHTATRALTALKCFAKTIKAAGVQSVHAVGTFTMRNILPTDPFINQANAALGHPIKILSGEQEATLIHSGICLSQTIDSPTLMIDIGGGSTELILANQQGIQHLSSMPVGCVHIQEMFLIKQSLNKSQFIAANNEVVAIIRPYADTFLAMGWDKVIGSSGTIRSIEGVTRENYQSISGVSYTDCEKLISQLQSFEQTENISLKGLHPNRQGVFPGGVTILSAILETLKIKTLSTSTTALREGLLQASSSQVTANV